MGLRWYAVPMVSFMMLDCGGIEYSAVPFNGWYMGTEIGSRDLCDESRYNITQVCNTSSQTVFAKFEQFVFSDSTDGALGFLSCGSSVVLQEVAENLGLDTQSNVSLWKDTALVEVNKAVLVSYKASERTRNMHAHHAT